MFSIFVLMMSGYIAKRTRLIHQKRSITFVDYVLTFALPALIFDKIYHINIDLKLINIILLGFLSTLIGATIVLLFGKIFKFTKVTITCMVLLSLFGNTIFVGLPVVKGFLGDSYANEVIFYDQFTTSIPISIFGPLILSFAVPQKVTLFQNAIKIMKFPPFIALLLGLICKNYQINEVLFDPLRMFSTSVVPVALFAIGVGLSFNSILSSWKSSLIVILGKMILPPIFFILVAKYFGIDISQKEWLTGAFMCAMPPMVLAGAMIMKANLDSNLAISSIALGVLVSFVSMPLIYFISTLL